VNESEYCTALRDRFLKRHPRAFWHKIPDIDKSQKPFDGFWICDGRTVCWEAKLHKEVGRWQFAEIEPHQIANLRRVWENKTSAYVVLGVRCVLKRRERKRLGTERARCDMDIWMPVAAIPGEGKDIGYTSLDVVGVWNMAEKKGGRIREVYLPKERLAQVAS
jgi:hypothetical protein